MKVLFNSETIESRINEIALQIWDRHKRDSKPIIMICVLDGGFMFYSKLVEKLAYLDPKCDFIKVKSYENQTRGDLQLILTNSHPVEDSHVYIVDDIYDSGITLNSLRDMLFKSNPKSVNLVTLIKRSINEIDFPKNSIYGFEIKSEWVIGFGMDDENGNKRSLPNILAI